jgi:hypothetical protein
VADHGDRLVGKAVRPVPGALAGRHRSVSSIPMLIPPSIADHRGVHRRARARGGSRRVPDVQGNRPPTGSNASMPAPFVDWCAARAIHRRAPVGWSPSDRRGDVWHVGCTGRGMRLASTDVWAVRCTGGVEPDGSTDGWCAVCTSQPTSAR